MPIRDLGLTAFIVGLLPVCFLRPWIGILVWSWLAYMNPHRHTWGFAYDIQFAMMVGAATLAGAIVSRDRKSFVWTGATVTFLLLWLWYTASSVFAIHPDLAWEKWKEVSKILVMTMITALFFQDRARLRYLLLVIAGSVGFYGLKGGIFVIGTGGQFMVRGAPGYTFISTNNAVALALNMILPLLWYLAREEPRRWARLLLYGTFFTSILSVLFTYSRGGVVGLLVVMGVLFLRRRNVLALIPAVLMLWLAMAWFAPERWQTRMDTIQNYEEDESANLRLVSWRVGYNLAVNSPLVGGGFKAFSLEAYAKYAPDYPYGYHDGHSIYFNLMGEHGFVGLGLFLVLIGFTLASLQRLRRWGRRHPELAWAGNYGHMLQASLAAYLSTGAFLSVSYFDLAYHLLIVAALLHLVAAREVEALTPRRAPAKVGRWPVPVRGAN